jgi:hypothetical protein
MSELSMDELQAETGELLPERETLGIVAIYNVGGAEANNYAGSNNTNTAINFQPVVVTNDSFNSHHTFLGFI